mmetsp:Transcript_57791/g.163048  ORF Transcript_57791/g.163048 Transcript_57791/m.163048 type:complete len:200 (+) Transcript_57791:235-834(+)
MGPRRVQRPLPLRRRYRRVPEWQPHSHGGRSAPPDRLRDAPVLRAGLAPPNARRPALDGHDSCGCHAGSTRRGPVETAAIPEPCDRLVQGAALLDGDLDPVAGKAPLEQGYRHVHPRSFLRRRGCGAARLLGVRRAAALGGPAGAGEPRLSLAEGATLFQGGLDVHVGDALHREGGEQGLARVSMLSCGAFALDSCHWK